MLETMNKDEKLRARFNELYNENKHLLENPDELYSKLKKLPDTKVKVKVIK